MVLWSVDSRDYERPGVKRIIDALLRDDPPPAGRRAPKVYVKSADRSARRRTRSSRP